MARSRGANSVLHGAFEITPGTPPASGFFKLPQVTNNLGEERGLIESDLLGLGRDMQDPTPDASEDSGEIVVPVDVANFGFWLKGALGDPTTTGTTDRVHTFTSGAANLPSLAVEVGQPDVPSYGMNFGATVGSLRVGMSRRGLLNCTVGLIARGETLAAASAAGTPTERAVQRFAQATGSVSWDGAALGEVVAADFTYDNDLDPVEVIRSDGRIAGVDAGMAKMSGNVTVRFASTALLDLAIANTPKALSFGWTYAANRSLLVTAHRVFLPRPKRPIEGPRGIQVTFPFQAAKDATAGKMATFVLSNAVNNY
jgi:hypothetical protein